MNVEPSPGSDSSVDPPAHRLRELPRDVEAEAGALGAGRAGGSVWWNRSKIRCAPRGMPEPRSVTANATRALGGATPRAARPRRSGGENFSAFCSRFVRIWTAAAGPRRSGGRARLVQRSTRDAGSPSPWHDLGRGTVVRGHRLAAERDLPGLDPRDDEEVLHQSDQPVGLLVDDRPGTRCVSSADSSASRRRSVSTNPRIAASGVRSSWLVIATKSDFISSSSRSRLSVSSCRRGGGRPARPARSDRRAGPAGAAVRDRSRRPVPALVQRCRSAPPRAQRHHGLGGSAAGSAASSRGPEANGSLAGEEPRRRAGSPGRRGRRSRRALARRRSSPGAARRAPSHPSSRATASAIDRMPSARSSAATPARIAAWNAATSRRAWPRARRRPRRAGAASSAAARPLRGLGSRGASAPSGRRRRR